MSIFFKRSGGKTIFYVHLVNKIESDKISESDYTKSVNSTRLRYSMAFGALDFGTL